MALAHILLTWKPALLLMRMPTPCSTRIPVLLLTRMPARCSRDARNIAHADAFGSLPFLSNPAFLTSKYRPAAPTIWDPRFTSLRRSHSYYLENRSLPRLSLTEVGAAVGAGSPFRGFHPKTICFNTANISFCSRY
ncbi:hypothetical protein F4604DRAFT_1915610 [Suillus subluteus]|nr:hypothetical protein F4604DRAFT_1915610 [Suillus subluteus]